MDEPEVTKATNDVSRAYALAIQYWEPSLSPDKPADTTVCLVNLDGSVWCDWTGLAAYARQPTPADPQAVLGVVFARALLAHDPGQPSHLIGPSVPVVSRAEAEAIAADYGQRFGQGA